MKYNIEWMRGVQYEVDGETCDDELRQRRHLVYDVVGKYRVLCVLAA